MQIILLTLELSKNIKGAFGAGAIGEQTRLIETGETQSACLIDNCQFVLDILIGCLMGPDSC